MERSSIVVESARISAIVEEALEKLSFLASITPDVMAHRDELSQIVGDEITRIIHEQRSLETRYEQLIAQRASLKALSNKVTSKFIPPSRSPTRARPGVALLNAAYMPIIAREMLQSHM